ncbi:hypothetical protein GCM10011379_13510 [Filimonas zeae]|uniref:Uncharacterized protein n=1 Tax=Filimonas zeae TaxID=1737353 RepID=A0A917ITM4_9BACT|nr:hypothetical protein GCM10011379_13510 [Filimonas zeae]
MRVKFSISYKDKPIDVETEDCLLFRLQYPNGSSKKMTFEFSSDCDFQWSFVTGPSQASEEAQEIGRQIEPRILSFIE